MYRLYERCAKTRARFGYAILRVDLNLCHGWFQSSLPSKEKSARISWQLQAILSFDSCPVRNARAIENLFDMLKLAKYYEGFDFRY